MSDTAIKVENLSKRYRIGLKEERAETLIGAMMAWLKAPLANFRQLRQLSHFSDTDQDSDDIIWALKDVSFEVKQGEVIGIIGHNGAGKSTLLKILTRITEPTAGRAIINGQVSSLLEVGTGFHPELTGRENIYLNGTILGMSKQEVDRKFDEIVDFSGVERFIDTPVKRYSSGMKVRLAFSVAAHLEPEILLVDEVLAVGDVDFQKKCLGKMGSVAKQGRTVLFVSHSMNAISQLCERVILIEHGKISADGKASEVISEYLGVQQNRLEGSSLDTWNIERRPRPFFEEVRINGVALPAELVVSTDDALQIRIIGDTGDIPVKPFLCGVHIATLDGIRLMSYGTAWSPLGDDICVNGKVLLSGNIARLPLVPGKYVMSIGCWDGGRQERVDWLENVCTLSVMPGKDIADRRIPKYKAHGYYLTESTWELE
jgi:ABC-type polysaccharide/polyol phosphate transport system ATPase subunit